MSQSLTTVACRAEQQTVAPIREKNAFGIVPARAPVAVASAEAAGGASSGQQRVVVPAAVDVQGLAELTAVASASCAPLTGQDSAQLGAAGRPLTITS